MVVWQVIMNTSHRISWSDLDYSIQVGCPPTIKNEIEADLHEI